MVPPWKQSLSLSTKKKYEASRPVPKWGTECRSPNLCSNGTAKQYVRTSTFQHENKESNMSNFLHWQCDPECCQDHFALPSEGCAVGCSQSKAVNSTKLQLVGLRITASKLLAKAPKAVPPSKNKPGIGKATSDYRMNTCTG